MYQGEVEVFPPMEPISTASAAFAVAIASSVRGTPQASMDAPPMRISVYSISCPNFSATLFRTFSASVTISGPIPSPLMTVILHFIRFSSKTFLILKQKIMKQKRRMARRFLCTTYSVYSPAFSTCAIADFCIGIRQFLLLPNSTITVSSVMSITVP